MEGAAESCYGPAPYCRRYFSPRCVPTGRLAGAVTSWAPLLLCKGNGFYLDNQMCCSTKKTPPKFCVQGYCGEFPSNGLGIFQALRTRREIFLVDWTEPQREWWWQLTIIATMLFWDLLTEGVYINMREPTYGWRSWLLYLIFPLCKFPDFIVMPLLLFCGAVIGPHFSFVAD